MSSSTDLLSPAAMSPHEAEWLGYSARGDTPDEVFDTRGQVRPHWQSFLRSLRDLGLAELTRRWSEARHIIRENGVTYNIYGDPRGRDRPWQLDPVPLLIT